MALTAVLVKQSANWLRYLITNDGSGAPAVITTTGAASPDLLTDSLAGPIKNLAKAFSQGFGQFAAGALTQAQARALWLSDWTGLASDPGNENTTTARCRITPRGTVGCNWTVDANVDGSGNPVLNISEDQQAAGTCYLDVEIPQVAAAGGIYNSLNTAPS